jgi:hypothetical protein
MDTLNRGLLFIQEEISPAYLSRKQTFLRGPHELNIGSIILSDSAGTLLGFVHELHPVGARGGDDGE